MEDILRRLGKHTREIRIQRGFGSQEEFVDYCKMHRTFLGHLETERKDSRLTTIIRVTLRSASAHGRHGLKEAAGC